jgi:anti-sigma B factor antagonist
MNIAPTSKQVQVFTKDNYILVQMTGDIGMAETSAIEADLTKIVLHRPRLVIIDLSGVSIVASIGMGAFVKFNNSIERWEGKVKFVALQPSVLQAFERCRLTEVFSIYDTEEAALAAV